MTNRLAALIVLALVFVPATSGPQLVDPGPPRLAGQTATLLSDGRWLLLGGEGSTNLSAAAFLWDPRAQVTVGLAGQPGAARAWHTATVLPDGSVLIFGGIGAGGHAIADAERFDPATESFAPLTTGLTPRAAHTATLLTDGRVLIAGGVGQNGSTRTDADLWDPRGRPDQKSVPRPRPGPPRGDADGRGHGRPLGRCRWPRPPTE
jgi:hypothetical protein